MKKIAVIMILCITLMGCSKHTPDKEVQKELSTYTEESEHSTVLDVNTDEGEPSENLNVNIGADEPSENLNVNTDEDELPQIVENTPSMELSQKLTSICDEMEQKKINTLKVDEADSAALFQQLFKCIECDWPAKEFVEQVKAKGEYTEVCHWYKFYTNEHDESEEESQYTSYIATPCSVAPSDEYYKVTSFCRNSENEKVINIIVENPYGGGEYLPTIKLDFSDESNVKLKTNDDEYLYIGDAGEEYSYLGVELTHFVNDNIFVGRYLDQNGISYEFTSDCRAIWGERKFSYDPLVLLLSHVFNSIEVLDDNKKGDGEYYGVKYEGGKLCLYNMEHKGDIVMAEKPFAVLTK